MKYTPAEKVAILRLHVVKQVPVAEICEQLNIAEEDFHLWMQEIYEDGVWPVDEQDRFPLRISNLPD
jgi:transposase-like protein